MRCAEEVDLLQEEMRRILAFLDWRAAWWTSLVGLRVEGDDTLREGHAAYALKEAGYLQGICERFTHLWRNVLEKMKQAQEEYAQTTADEMEGEEEDADGEGAGTDTGTG
ncbi:hypothetical protein K438DRAFT_1986399 [Mycena galopus ATCC 62051]|nr:hypothetical protein K438DRAFT_1986399 [Mycena galopus ATCC 62051]